MAMLHALRILAHFAFLLLPSVSWAGVWTVCVEYKVSFVDADTAVGDDYFTSNADRPARGAMVRIKEVGGSIIAEDNAEDSGADAGCLVGVVLATGTAYEVRVLSSAVIGGNTLEVRDDPVSPSTYAEEWTWTPGSGTRKTFDTTIRDEWNVAAAAGFALLRQDAGMTGKGYRFYMDDSSCTSGLPSCVQREGGAGTPFRVFMCSVVEGDTGCPSVNPPAYAKYVINHNLGHVVTAFANGGDRALLNQSATATTSGDCDDNGGGHAIHTEEYHSSAAWEGIAHLWAAMAFNDHSAAGDGCRFDYYLDVDWDNDLDNDEDRFNCDGAPDPIGAPDVDGDDYTLDECDGTVGRGTELDWLRFWWDLVTDEGLNDDQVWAIWADADSDGWSANGTGDAEDQPPERLRHAAYLNGLVSKWTTWDDVNGVDE
jgi:hypothetical protein